MNTGDETLYQVRAVTRTPPTHKRMAHYEPIEGDPGVITNEAGLPATISEVIAGKTENYVIISIFNRSEPERWTKNRRIHDGSNE